jgi:enoyl-CoA hydratase/carnithine racemase
MTLNTPKSLNALTLASINTVKRTLVREDKYKLTVLNGAGRAFCAGGDVWSVAKQGPTPMNEKAEGLSNTSFWHAHMSVCDIKRMPVSSCCRFTLF